MEIIIKDIAIASYLLASEQVHLVKTERENKKLVVFFFSPKEVAEKLVADYWADKASPIPPRKLFSAQRSLKDLIFSGS